MTPARRDCGAVRLAIKTAPTPLTDGHGSICRRHGGPWAGRRRCARSASSRRRRFGGASI